MKKYLNTSFYKTVGFYFAIVSILLAIFGNIFYLGFSGTLLEYRNASATIPAFVAIAVYGGLLLFKKTSNFASIALWALNFVTFLLFILYVYMYFSGVFYNGVTSEAIALIDGKVILCIVFYSLAAIFSNVSIYLKGRKDN
ncbi:MAG TPA: hypothetical protein DDW18_04645 [Firmicutes bacterium]|nr:hypothetical protein [Bacillota bacterium]